jgi:hypothetical protein
MRGGLLNGVNKLGKSAPKAPDPVKTAAAQTGTNVATATANSYLGNINEVTPDGSVSFAKSGMQDIFDPSTGKTYQVPQFTKTQTLSGNQQAIKDQQDAASLNLSSLGNTLSGKLGNQLTDNFKLGNESTEARLMELGRKRLDPAFANRRGDMQAQLSNQGIKLGSAAYDRAMKGLGEQENDAYNQLLLSGRGQASQEQLTEDNQRINQISALMNGGQVSQPNFLGANMPNIPTTDYAGLVNQKYQADMNAYNQKQSMWGGLLSGLGSAAFALSDERAKENIEPVGKLKGQNIYTWNYKDGMGPPGKHMGVMAQEVAKKKPDAVVKGADGLLRVNLNKTFALGA